MLFGSLFFARLSNLLVDYPIRSWINRSHVSLVEFLCLFLVMGHIFLGAQCLNQDHGFTTGQGWRLTHVFFQITFLVRNALNWCLFKMKRVFVIYEHYSYFSRALWRILSQATPGFSLLCLLLGWGSFNFCQVFCLMFSKTGAWIQEFLCMSDQRPKRYLLNYQVLALNITPHYSMTPVKCTQCTQLPKEGVHLGFFCSRSFLKEIEMEVQDLIFSTFIHNWFILKRDSSGTVY